MIGGIGQGSEISKMISGMFEKINNEIAQIHKKDVNYDENKNFDAIEFAKNLEKAFENEEAKLVKQNNLILQEQLGMPLGLNIQDMTNLINDKQIEVSGSMANNFFFNKNNSQYVQNLIKNYTKNRFI